MAEGKEYCGSTVADAIANACAELAVSQEELDIVVLETGSAGIFGLCRKKARIRVSRKERPTAAAAKSAAEPAPPPAKKEQKKKDKPVREKKKKTAEARSQPEQKPEAPIVEPERGAEEDDEPAASPAGPYVPPTPEALEAVQKDVAALLDLMGCSSTVTVSLERQTVACKISGEHQQILTGQDGRTLDSLQYLLRKMTAKLLPDRTKLSVEVGDYRERRLEELKRHVLELAAQVREDGMTQAIPALNPSERRMVHMTLQDDKEIRSRSVGDGLFKKVLIYKPGKKKPFPRKGGKAQQDGSPAED